MNTINQNGCVAEHAWKAWRNDLIRDYVEKDRIKEPYRVFFQEHDWEELARTEPILEKIKELQVLVNLCKK